MRGGFKITDHTITADDLIAAGACYSEEKVRRLVPDTMLMSELLDLDIPDADKVRGVLMMIGSDRERVGATAALVRDVAHLTGDCRVHRCLDTCDCYAIGEASDEELAEASVYADDAYSVACACRVAIAARVASAASYAGAAASGAVIYASMAAMAARSAEHDRTAAQNRQVERLRELLKASN